MRIIKGKYAGRLLTSPGGAVRPTPETLRDRCLDLLDREIRGARVLDLFAGSGAMGLEALSRGARSVDFVENGASALHALKANVAALRVTRKCRIFKKDAVGWIEGLGEGSYDIAFVDAPYGSKKLDLVLERWRKVRFAHHVAIEHAKDHALSLRGKRYDFEGPSRLTILQARKSATVSDGSRPYPGGPPAPGTPAPSKRRTAGG